MALMSPGPGDTWEAVLTLPGVAEVGREATLPASNRSQANLHSKRKPALLLFSLINLGNLGGNFKSRSKSPTHFPSLDLFKRSVTTCKFSSH